MQVEIVDLSPETTQNSKARSPVLSKIFVALFAALLMLNVAIFAFLIGRNSNQKPQTEVQKISEQLTTPQALGAGTTTTDSTTSNEITPTTNAINTSPTPTPIQKEIVIYSTANLDGFRTSSGVGSSVSAIQVGGNQDTISRGFLTFDLTKLPNTARITKAVLEVYTVNTVGNSSRMGNLLIDHLIYGDNLNHNDYASVAILSSFTRLEQMPEDTKWLTAEVTNAVRNDRDSIRPQTQFRLHYENEVKPNSDNFIFLESGENYLGTKNLPRLLVNYE